MGREEMEALMTRGVEASAGRVLNESESLHLAPCVSWSDLDHRVQRDRHVDARLAGESHQVGVNDAVDRLSAARHIDSALSVSLSQTHPHTHDGHNVAIQPHLVTDNQQRLPLPLHFYRHGLEPRDQIDVAFASRVPAIESEGRSTDHPPLGSSRSGASPRHATCS